MSSDPVDGGTVTYHRADWHPDGTWAIRFTEDGPQRWVSWAEGEAMGLTVPSPAESEVAELVDRYGATGVGLALLAHDDVTNVDDFLDGLLDRWMSLRDARQDPQPASDEPNTHVLIGSGPHVRPITPKPQPEQDASGIDFDALPIGTVIRDKWGDLLLRREGGWFEGDEECFLNADDGPYTVVYRPPALSPRQCLEALLAGRDDADELMAHAANESPNPLLMRALGDAARGGAA